MTDPQPGTPTAGALLRAAREKQGLHIAALAAAIKVSPRKLDALENDRWHELPDATFVRALAQTVCRTLKIESRPVMALLPITGEVMLEPVSNVLNEPFRDRPGRDGGGPGAAAIRPMVAIGLLLLLAAVVVYFLPASLWAPSPADPLVAQPSAPAAASAQPEAAPATWAADGASSPSGVSMVAADTAPAASSSPAAAGASAAPSPPPGALASAATGAAAGAGATAVAQGAAMVGAPAATPGLPVAANPPATAGSGAAGLLQLRSTQASWVDVRDARGSVLLSRIVQPGEAVGLDGALPLRLTIGNAAGTQVSFRGKAVDMTGRTRDNVARLELQ
ncbi:MAG: helix-turn-helix domain-containing protein [Rubrivivax sp.]|jgi:cytoskeleton protein RodZ|nr:helix-turn-helix domain-containing protein [Rubrivivax sp.]